jgi:hypothetical protein
MVVVGLPYSFQGQLGTDEGFAAMPATWRPWKRAPSSSTALGWRLPSPPAMVEAP